MSRRVPFQHELCNRIDEVLAGLSPAFDPIGYLALAYLKLPGPNFHDVLRVMHGGLKPKKYVEVGVGAGETLALAGEDTWCCGIDPKVDPAIMRKNYTLYITTDDDFFEAEHRRERIEGFQLALINGERTLEQAARTFSNLERLASRTAFICLRDVIPVSAATSGPERKARLWTGDMWRLMALIVAERPDLMAFTIACAPTGLGIIGGLGEARGADFAPDLIADMSLLPLDTDWGVQCKRLNIVPNERTAITEALAAGTRRA